MSDSAERIHIKDYGLVQQTKRHVTLGHYFVFVDHPKALKGRHDRGTRGQRLLLDNREDTHKVLPLVEQTVELAGVDIKPAQRTLAPIACLVADRDLYRAEQDTVHLFVAAPKPPAGLRLLVEYNGQLLVERTPELEDGVGIEALSGLLPGTYTARLLAEECEISAAVSFTVAEYTLPPLASRLLSHQFDRTCAELGFELSVESYQVPLEETLQVALVDQGRELSRIRLEPTAPGRYCARLPVSGDGPFRLRLSAVGDAERITEVAIPGSRTEERELTIVSELGREMLFSLLPEPGTLPIRGGYLTAGQFNDTVLTVPEVVTGRRILQANAALESLILVILDLTTGGFEIQPVGAVDAGQEIEVKTGAPLCNVFAGCFVEGRPFEGYTTFFAPSKLALGIEAPETIRPRRDLTLCLGCSGADKPVPVLLCVRDARLTAADVPDVSLGAALKRGIEAATRDMAETGFQSLDELVSRVTPVCATALDSAAVSELDDVLFGGAVVAGAAAEDLDDFECEGDAEASGWLEQVLEAPAPARTLFPEVLFYGIVAVHEQREITVPLGDALSTLTVEAFALSEGDWAGVRTAVVVDQPVRIDLELPHAVYSQDKVSARLRAATAVGNARITLSCDGKPVPLYWSETGDVVEDTPLPTPATLEFQVMPGTYLARVEDLSTGESDSVEMRVESPGCLRSYSRGVSSLQAGDELDLGTAEALSLRVLPALEEPFEALLKTTAGYAHLCCEQTAAKILAATFMYLTSTEVSTKTQAEEIILAGIARERQMLRPRKGFSMYPGRRRVSEFYSRLAVRYLWSLDRLEQVASVSPSLRKAVAEGLAMADTAARAHGMERWPQRLQHMEDAYAAATAGGDANAVRVFIDAHVDFSGPVAQLRRQQHAVADRALLAYAAASLIALGDWRRGIPLANQVTRQFNQQGALYSTVDSVAAIVLMIQLQASGLVSGGAQVRVNGREMTALEAAGLGVPQESVQVLEGVVPVEIIRIVEEDWGAFTAAFPLKVDFRDDRDRPKKSFSSGDKADLRVRLGEGYELGDLLHVVLPAGLSWLQGGGKVKRFTLDFAGKDELRVPLVVTSEIDGKQHFAVCVRNMFEEERASSPGLLFIEGKRRSWPGRMLSTYRQRDSLTP